MGIPIPQKNSTDEIPAVFRAKWGLSMEEERVEEMRLFPIPRILPILDAKFYCSYGKPAISFLSSSHSFRRIQERLSEIVRGRLSLSAGMES
ncbi:MAG: hypothetical protein ACLFNZ_11210 [Spirochaetaceae bacterium]